MWKLRYQAKESRKVPEEGFQSSASIRVIHHQRCLRSGGQSIERIHADLRDHMPTSVEVTVHFLRFTSHGVLRRLYNLLEASLPTRNRQHLR